MPVRIVQSKQNARLKQLRRALANPGQAGSPAGIEGASLIAEALRARLRIQCAFTAQGFEDQLRALSLPSHTEILLLPRPLLDAAQATESPQPVAALVEPPQWTWVDLLGGHPRRTPLVVVLAGLQDPGNLGTILRSAEAFGATGVVCLPGTVNPWNPKAVRASAGSIFRLPLVAATAEECFEQLNQANLRVLTTAVRGLETFHDSDLAGPVGLLIGNEGNGVPQELARLAHAAIAIPTPGPVESLNAAVAASILLYEAARQRSGARQ